MVLQRAMEFDHSSAKLNISEEFDRIRKAHPLHGSAKSMMT